MNDEKSRHLADETMAAFVEGTLSPAERATAARHLADCSDCRIIVAEGARFEEEEEEESSRSKPWWLIVAAAVVIAIFIALPLLRRKTAIDTLVAAAPHTHRNVEARLAGFPWARLQAPTRGKGVANPEDLKLQGAAGSVLESKDPHAIGVAYLLIDHRPESIETLERAAESSHDAAVWNDLAAARLATALRDDHPAQLPLALAAVDHALRLDPKFAPALFNRALILEHLALRDAARSAWQQYLKVDPSGDWSAEARTHLAKLSEHTDVFDPKALRTATGAQLEALVRRFPQDARLYADLFLAEWGKSRSDELLAQTRAIGAWLGSLHGDWLLADAVAAIDRADDRTREQLAEVHLEYGDARLAYRDRHVAVAEALFRRAAARFRDCGSPMAVVAGYYEGQCAFDLNKGTIGLGILRTTVDAKRHRALAADIERELALAATAAGDSAAAIRHADVAAEIFRSLGERQNAGASEAIAATALALAGDEDRAWRRYSAAFSNLGLPSLASRRRNVLEAAGTTLMLAEERDAAAAVFKVTLDERGDMGSHTRAIACARQARLSPSTSDRWLADARHALTLIPERTVRDTVKAEVDLAEAVVKSARSPRAFDAPIAFMKSRPMNALLPDALLQRARAYRALGNDRSALADCTAARELLEQKRNDDPSASAVAAQIADEMIAIHLRDGDSAAAFRIADASHQVPALVPSHTALVEYASLPTSLVIFARDAAGLGVWQVPLTRRELKRAIAALNAAITAREPEAQVQEKAATLYLRMVTPIEHRLIGVDDLIVIPDRHTSNIPFAALYDRRNKSYLIERCTIQLAESASLRAMPAGILPALVISDPATGADIRLGASRKEAQAVASMYDAEVLDGTSATRERFASAVKESALIHYAGHAVSGALMLASGDSDSGMLEAADVSHLAMQRQPLVVLAACDTFHQLSHAFLAAGARGVIGTLWEIDDEASAALFLRFHEQLRASKSPAHSLRDAQLSLLRSSESQRRHPASWAGVELISNATNSLEDKS